MKLATVRHADRVRVGVIEGGPGDERVHLVDQPVTALELLRRGDLHEVGRAARGTRPVPLADVRLLPPLEPPTVRDFVAFEEHVEGVRRSVSDESGVPDAWYDAPTFYFTNPHAVIGAHDDVPLPPGCRVLDFELEVAAVIGREGATSPPTTARDHIAGYTILNDWSARDLQAREMQVGLGPAKGKDTATHPRALARHRRRARALSRRRRLPVPRPDRLGQRARGRRGPALQHGVALRGPRRLRLPRHPGPPRRRPRLRHLRQRRLPGRAVGPGHATRGAAPAAAGRRRHPPVEGLGSVSNQVVAGADPVPIPGARARPRTRPTSRAAVTPVRNRTL